MVCDNVACEKVVCVCERGCVTKMVCSKNVSERWRVTKLCVIKLGVTKVCVCVKDGVCVCVNRRWCVTKMCVTKLCVENGMWRYVLKMVRVKDCVWQRCVWKMLRDKVVCVCERWCVTKLCVTKMVCDKVVCVCVRKMVCDSVWQSCVDKVVCDNVMGDTRPEPAQCHKCHACCAKQGAVAKCCHAKRRSKTPSATPATQKCRGVTCFTRD